MIVLQWNEADIPLIKKYTRLHGDRLPNLKQFFEEAIGFQTYGLDCQDELEPWIQWVSFYTRKPAGEHNIRFLGGYDILDSDDTLAALARKVDGNVGFVFPMNHPGVDEAKLFLSDPWCKESSKGGLSLLRFRAIAARIVLNNSSLKLILADLFGLLSSLRELSFRKSIKIVTLVAFYLSIGKKHVCAPIFDLFIFNYVLKKSKANIKNYVFFLNGLAHVQHHSMSSSVFSSVKAYKQSGLLKRDDIFDSLKTYDALFGEMMRSHTEISVITALGQDFVRPVLYWRITRWNRIASFLEIALDAVELKMSRDFVIKTGSENYQRKIVELLEAVSMFEGCEQSLGAAFSHIEEGDGVVRASFAYAGEGRSGVYLNWNNKVLKIDSDISFVAEKNTGHTAEGHAYFWGLTDEKKRVVNNIDLPISIWECGEIVEQVF